MASRDTGFKVLLLALVAVFLGAFLWDSDQAAPSLGDRLPAFDLTDERGARIRLADFAGKVVVVNFWATWCPPCIEEMPSLDQFQRTFAGKGVEVIAISLDEDEKAYRDFLAQRNLKIRTVRDPSKKVAMLYGTFKYPESYIADRQGRLVRKIVGPADWMDPRIQSLIAGLTGG
jgi:peroxiredoxin